MTSLSLTSVCLLFVFIPMGKCFAHELELRMSDDGFNRILARQPSIISDALKDIKTLPVMADEHFSTAVIPVEYIRYGAMSVTFDEKSQQTQLQIKDINVKFSRFAMKYHANALFRIACKGQVNSFSLQNYELVLAWTLKADDSVPCALRFETDADAVYLTPECGRRQCYRASWQFHNFLCKGIAAVDDALFHHADKALRKAMTDTLPKKLRDAMNTHLAQIQPQLQRILISPKSLTQEERIGVCFKATAIVNHSLRVGMDFSFDTNVNVDVDGDNGGAFVLYLLFVAVFLCWGICCFLVGQIQRVSKFMYNMDI